MLKMAKDEALDESFSVGSNLAFFSEDELEQPNIRRTSNANGTALVPLAVQDKLSIAHAPDDLEDMDVRDASFNNTLRSKPAVARSDASQALGTKSGNFKNQHPFRMHYVIISPFEANLTPYGLMNRKPLR